MIRILATVSIVLVLFSFAPISSADSIATWTLNGVTLGSDVTFGATTVGCNIDGVGCAILPGTAGGTATGSFVFDATTDTVLSANIVTSLGTLIGGVTYAAQNPNFLPGPDGSIPGAFDIVFVPSGFPSSTAALLLVLQTDLTNPGVPVPLVNGMFNSGEYACGEMFAFCDTADITQPFRNTTAGEVEALPPVSAPEPSALLLLGMGMGLITLAGVAKSRIA
jgi:hypothetical protein